MFISYLSLENEPFTNAILKKQCLIEIIIIFFFTEQIPSKILISWFQAIVISTGDSDTAFIYL